MVIRVERFEDGVVVNDGQFLWTADEAALEANRGLYDAANEAGDDGDESGHYSALCSKVPYLARTEPERHARIVEAWRAEHAPNKGNWS